MRIPLCQFTLTAALLITGSSAAWTADSGEAAPSDTGSTGASRPNIVVILADDLGYGDLGCTGSRYVRSPSIDRLAAQGCFCERAYAAGPMCAPSRMALMTARQPKRYGITVNPNWKHPALPESRYGLPTDEKILPEYLAPLGYTCAAVGKWHLGHVPGQLPVQRGFSVWWGFLGGSRHYVPMRHEQEGLNPSRILSSYDEQPRVSYLTDDISRESVRFIRSCSEPFFLYVAYNAPHWPLESLPQDREVVREHADGTPLEPDRLHYAAMIHAMDRGVGRIVDALRERGVDGRTWIFFASDNGGVPEPYSSNAPWRGHKRLHYEGGVRVPFIVRPPMGWEIKPRCAEAVSLMDILPTVLELNGVLPMETAHARQRGYPWDGRSMMPFLRGKAPVGERVLHWCTDGTAAIMRGDWKLMLADGQPPCLYHLGEDPGESRNCADAKPEQVETLRQDLLGYLTGTPPPRYPENPAWSSKLVREHRDAAHAAAAPRVSSPPALPSCSSGEGSLRYPSRDYSPSETPDPPPDC